MTEEKKDSFPTNQTRYRAIVLWLFGLFCFGLFLRFNTPKPEAGGLQPSVQIAQRFVLIAKYGGVDENLSSQLLEAAEQLEGDKQLQHLIRGEKPEGLSKEELSPVYRLLLEDLSEPNTESRKELEELT